MSAIKNAKRFRTFVRVGLKYGFYDLLHKLHLVGLGERLQGESVYIGRSINERFRLALEELGVAFIKLGQLISTRTDLFPESLCVELAKLKDDVKPVDFAIINQVMVADFGENWMESFEFFDPKPIASASLAQIHRGQLKSGPMVVSKILKPKAFEHLEEDLAIMKYLAHVFDQALPEFSPLPITLLVDEFFKSIRSEINYTAETNHLQRFSALFENHPDISVPKTYLDICSQNVITMEFIEGVSLRQGPIALSQERANSLACGLAKGFLQNLLERGLYHADLHDGNLLFIPSLGKIGIVDFGSVGTISKKNQYSLAMILHGMISDNFEAVGEEFLLISQGLDWKDHESFSTEVREILTQNSGNRNLSVGSMLLGIARTANKYRMELPKDLILLFRTILYLEGSLNKIDTKWNWRDFLAINGNELLAAWHQPPVNLAHFLMSSTQIPRLIASLPFYLRAWLRRKADNEPTSVALKQMDELVQSLNLLSLRIFWGLISVGTALTGGIVFSQSHLAASLLWFLSLVALLFGRK